MSWQQTVSKSGAKASGPKPKFNTNDDDWETDITYENKITERSQRYGSTSVLGSGRIDHVDFDSLRDKIKSADDTVKETYQQKNPNHGYGGKYGVERVMDKTATDFSYEADIKKHPSQTDSKKGFGGEHGIDNRARDKSALGFDYKATVEKHSSQTDSSKGFGGKYGVDQHAQDKSVVEFSYKELLPKHSSQTNYTTGFGGKYGVQKQEPVRSSGAASSEPFPESKAIEKPVPPISIKADVDNIRAKFENIKKEHESETAKRVIEERMKRAANDQQLRQRQQSINNDKEKIEQVRQVSKIRETTRPKVQTEPEVSSPNLYENDENNFETIALTTNEKPDKFVAAGNITSSLSQGKTSPSSSKNNDDDNDKWVADKNDTNEETKEERNSLSISDD